MEVACQLIIAKDLEYIEQNDFDFLYETTQELSRMLNGLYQLQYGDN